MNITVKERKNYKKTTKPKEMKKSKLVLFWEKMPPGEYETVDMKAILK